MSERNRRPETVKRSPLGAGWTRAVRLARETTRYSARPSTGPRAAMATRYTPGGAAGTENAVRRFPCGPVSTSSVSGDPALDGDHDTVTEERRGRLPATTEILSLAGGP